MNRLPEYARTALEGCIRDTEGGTRITMVIALSYSSKWELTNAARKIAGDVAKGVLQEKILMKKPLAVIYPHAISLIPTYWYEQAENNE